jgi:glutamate 5-kinase
VGAVDGVRAGGGVAADGLDVFGVVVLLGFCRVHAAVQDAINGDETASFGGIQTKVAGAREVSEHGTPAIIARSDREGVLEDIVAEKAVGTIFVPMNGESDE